MNNKIYLVSEVQCFNDERMCKRFSSHKSKEDAIKQFEQLKSLWNHELCDYYDCTNDELEEWIEITCDEWYLFSWLSSDGCTEVEIEITELELE